MIDIQQSAPDQYQPLYLLSLGVDLDKIAI